MAVEPGYLVVYDLLPEIAAALEDAASAIVRKAALDIEAAAKTTAPVETGYLRNSVYTVTKTSSGYADAAGMAAPGDSYLLPEVARPTSTTTAYVAVGANYGSFVEFGTSRAAAQPYLIPAADLVRPAFLAAMGALEGAMGKGLPHVE